MDLNPYNTHTNLAEDQNTGAEWLIEQGLAKAGHIGIYGWSDGGFLSAISLARFPNTFQLAVSEKYTGFPWEHTEDYEYGLVMHHVDKLKGKLLFMHGLIDENIHFRCTARLLNPYELLVFLISDIIRDHRRTYFI